MQLSISLAAGTTELVIEKNKAIAEKYGAEFNLTEQEWKILEEPSRILLVRAGKVLGASLAGVLSVIDPRNQLKNPVIAVDGSVINNPMVRDVVWTWINRLSGHHVEFKTIGEATAVGTAVSAAVSPIEADAAMVKPGGINLDAAMMDFQIRRDGRGVPLSWAQQSANIQVNGFEPNVRSVSPVSISALIEGIK